MAAGTTFTYAHCVSGKNFIGRKNDIASIGNLLWQGENVAIYGPPRCGLSSLMRQVFLQLESTGRDMGVAEVPMLGTRTAEAFLRAIGESVIRTLASSPEEYAGIMENCLTGSHFTFDQEGFASCGQILSTDGEADMEDALAIFRLPYLLAEEKGRRICVAFDDFQNVTSIEGFEGMLKTFEDVAREMKGSQWCTFVFGGTALNAMKWLFEVKKYFWRLAERYTPSPIAEKDIMEHVTRGLLASGKVVDNELLIGVCRLFRCDIWYVNHFMSICDHLSKGYVMEPILLEALECILSLHRPRFKAEMRGLTNFQVGLLKAILDGHGKFSTSEVIGRYGLNSSANVKRLKDALFKKEIISFDERGDAYVIDPLFEYWARKEFFGQGLGL